MFRRSLFVIAALIVSAGAEPALAGEDPLAETLSFRPMTTSRITQLVEPESSNEKEVEYGDFDEDGDLDVVIANAYSDFGDRRNKLYENVDGHFNEITLSGAIPGFAVTKVSRNVFLRDFDGDDHLDIWVINDSNSHADQVFLASWAGNEFVQFVETSGRIPGGGLTGAACGGWSADFDQDGDPDVYCGNYPNSAQDRLFENNGFGFFTDITSTHVPTAGDYVVDVNGADMNGDGNLDLLISNHGNNNNWIYYNDNNGAGSGLGDFQYTGSTQSLGDPIANENSMEAADLDGDLDLDVYWSNASGNTGDRILRNNGNDGSNQATFTSLDILPLSVTNTISRKATVADLNNDGRRDVFVMKEDGWGRPTVLRNTTVGGVMSFVDWTPAAAFPSADWHEGWHAVVFDTNNDGDLDIFLGGWQGDHLFENHPPADFAEAGLAAGVIPDLYDRDAAAVIGSVGEGDSDTFVAEGVGANGLLSFVLNGADDYLVQILDASDTVLATINRGGVGVEEAGQYDWTTAPSTLKVRVTGVECASVIDLDGDCGVGVTDFLQMLAAWGPNPGHPADYNSDGEVGITDFLDLLANWGDSEYVLEVLARGI
jgi:hypothetical protein